ncbi:hypothetical protein [Falsirhodobacter xinxiangensis]|uniref:hypothetical protein n=1 Tax=Falsirhodobacter xinxiangensis TaxID=2530049 RepID=UPI0010A9A97E|nr:hypothetical protein [Rhodobacter xinxiangensis]
MIERKFPMQQGDLDYFCSIYAVINLLHTKGQVADLSAAGVLFTKLIEAIDAEDGGSVAATATRGVYREDVLWLLEVLGHECSKSQKPTARQIVEGAGKGAIVFFKAPGEQFDHYTVVSADATEDRLALFDSYDFEAILRDGDRWTLNGKTVEILNLYVLG